MTTPEWIGRAACRGVGFEIFFPADHESAEPALAYCRACDVIDECLESELARPSSLQFGVFGGMRATQRRRLIEHRRRVTKREGTT